MRILVSGCVSKHANPAKNRRDVMVSWLIAECLRDLGHEVEHRDPTVLETYEEFDRVFLGLAPFHALGANRTYGVLSAFLKAGYDKTVFFLDDPDVGKVMTGIRSCKKDPLRLFKPFFENRLDYPVASTPEYRQWLSQAIDRLYHYAWPRTLLPVFPWADTRWYQEKLPNALDLVSMDFSAYVPAYVTREDWSTSRKRTWVTETRPDSRWIQQQRPIYDVVRFGRGFEKRPVDPELARVYTKVWGVLDEGIPHGFFNSRLLYAAQAGALYVTDHKHFKPGSILADHAAGLSEQARDEWAAKQYDDLHHILWSQDNARDAMAFLLQTKVNA